LRLDELIAELVDLGLELGKLLEASGESVLKPPLGLPRADQIGTGLVQRIFPLQLDSTR
jgi:hypothetical protein